ADADSYAFRHHLIRQAVREDLLPGERTQAERAFAAALEAGPALGGDGIVQVQIALHWRGANEYGRALRAAWEAAADAGARFAFAEQLQMLEQVLDLWDRVPAAAEHTRADRTRVVELAADAARWAHEPERGLALVEPALDEACESGDPAHARRCCCAAPYSASMRCCPGRLTTCRRRSGWPPARTGSAPRSWARSAGRCCSKTVMRKRGSRPSRCWRWPRGWATRNARTKR